VFLYFKFLERDGNRGPRPASVILIGLDWIGIPLVSQPVQITAGILARCILFL